MDFKNLTIEKIIYDTIINNKDIGHFYKNKYISTKHSLNDIINEIIYVLKNGVSWRNLRSSINYNSIYYHFKRFVKFNIFIDAYNNILNKYFYKIKNINGIIIDSSFIQNKNGRGNIPRNSFFKNKKCYKLSVVSDFNNIPLSVSIVGGNIHDSVIFDNHKKDITNCSKYFNKDIYFLADKAYLSNNIRNFCTDKKIQYLVPNKTNSKNNISFNDYQQTIYKKRISIEHLFARIKQFRRISLIYDSKLITYSNFVFMALLIILLEKVSN